MVNKKYVFVLCVLFFTISCCSRRHKIISSHAKVYHLKNGTYGVQDDGNFYVYFIGSEPYSGSNASLVRTSNGRWMDEGKITSDEKQEMEIEEPVEEVETTEAAEPSEAGESDASSESDGGGSDGGGD